MSGSKAALITYLSVSLLQWTGVLLEYFWMAAIFKLLLMPTLLLYFWKEIQTDSLKRFGSLALAFSWFGDIALLSDDLFLIGMICFLLAHLAYVIAYIKSGVNFQNQQILKLAVSFVLFLVGFVMGQLLLPGAGDLTPYLTGYMGVIVVMGVSSFFRLGGTSALSFFNVFIGAMLFMLSDSLIGYSRFVGPIPNDGIMIMTTYAVAQLLIIRGLILHTDHYS